MQSQSEQIHELATALAKAQGEMGYAKKSSLNPHFKSRFADLSEVWEACREELSKNGLAVLQTMNKDDHGVLCLSTLLTHSSGQWIRSMYPLLCKDNTSPQVMGSCITYARRYCLSAMVGIAPSDEPDDDGEKTVKMEDRKPISKPPAPPPPKLMNKDQLKDYNQLYEKSSVNMRNHIDDVIISLNIQSLSELWEDTYFKLKNVMENELKRIGKN